MPLRERRSARRPLAWAAAGLAAVATAGGIAVAAEPNDTVATATGPLTAGQTYRGSLETAGDVDFQFFYVPDAHKVTVAVINAAEPGNKAANRRRALQVAVLQDRRGKPPVPVADTAARIRPGKESTAKVTLAPGKYLIPVLHAADKPLADIPFRIRITPVGVTTDSYEIFARRCAGAIAKVHRIHRSKVKLAKRVRKARRQDKEAKEARLEKKLAIKRFKAKIAHRNKRIACSVPR